MRAAPGRRPPGSSRRRAGPVRRRRSKSMSAPPDVMVKFDDETALGGLLRGESASRTGIGETPSDQRVPGNDPPRHELPQGPDRIDRAAVRRRTQQSSSGRARCAGGRLFSSTLASALVSGLR